MSQLTQTHRLIFRNLSARQEISAFIRWVKETGYKVSRKTYYRAFEQEARTATQQLALELSERYAREKGYITTPPTQAAFAQATALPAA